MDFETLGDAAERIALSNGANGGTTSPTSAQDVVILQNAALVAAHTIALPGPANAYDGQEITVCSLGGVTALTVTQVGWGSGFGAPTSLAAGGFFKMTCSFAHSGWVRTG